MALLLSVTASAETVNDAWLRYEALDESVALSYRPRVPAVLVTLGSDLPVVSARGELVRGIRGMLGRTLRLESAVPEESAILLGTVADIRAMAPEFAPDSDIPEDGFLLRTVQHDFVSRYFDHLGGTARFEVRVAGQTVDEWRAADRVPTRRPDSSSSSRRVISGIALRQGDEIRIIGFPENDEKAELDYVEIRETAQSDDR